MQITIAAMEQGKITSAECVRRCNAYKEALSTMLHLRTLELNGIADTIDAATADLDPETPKVAGEKTVTIKRGVSPQGAPIDETTVVVHSTATAEDE